MRLRDLSTCFDDRAFSLRTIKLRLDKSRLHISKHADLPAGYGKLSISVDQLEATFIIFVLEIHVLPTGRRLNTNAAIANQMDIFRLAGPANTNRQFTQGAAIFPKSCHPPRDC